MKSVQVLKMIFQKYFNKSLTEVRIIVSFLGLLGTLASVVGVPVGGYADSLQNLGGYDRYGNRDSGYGDEPANYDFQYEVYGGGNFFGHQESRRDDKTNGKYHVLLPDGRRQIVTYIADETGYHPTVTYEVVSNSPDTNSGGYGGNEYNSPSGGYGSPVSDNSLGNGSPNRYSSRIKRQFYAPDNFTDVVKTYKSESNPNLRFRNRRRRHSSAKKGYLVIYPDSFSKNPQDSEVERIFVPE